jgi:hypothetical protein
MIGRETYIRVVITKIRNGSAYCIPVNKDHEAFDGAGSNALAPGMLVVELDAVVPAPIEIPVQECPLYYAGKRINKVKGTR